MLTTKGEIDLLKTWACEVRAANPVSCFYEKTRIKRTHRPILMFDDGVFLYGYPLEFYVWQPRFSRKLAFAQLLTDKPVTIESKFGDEVPLRLRGIEYCYFGEPELPAWYDNRLLISRLP